MTLVQRVREIYDDAKASLGPALGGGSITDLIADNTEASLDDIRVACIDSGVWQEWEAARCQNGCD